MFDMGQDATEGMQEDTEAVREALRRLARVAREESARLADIAPLTSAAFAAAADVWLFGAPPG